MIQAPEYDSISCDRYNFLVHERVLVDQDHLAFEWGQSCWLACKRPLVEHYAAEIVIEVVEFVEVASLHLADWID